MRPRASVNNQEQSESAAISMGTVCSLGSNPRRLTLIRVLATEDRKLTLNDLTKEIAVRETGKEIADISGDKLTRMMTVLHHNHVPRLAEAGAVTYDSERKTVAPTETLKVIHSQLKPIRNSDAEL